MFSKAGAATTASNPSLTRLAGVQTDAPSLCAGGMHFVHGRRSTPLHQLLSLLLLIDLAHCCSAKWRAIFVKSGVVAAEKLAQFDGGTCGACLGICACKRCLSQRNMKIGGGAPRFSRAQHQLFAEHMLMITKPHVEHFLACRKAEVSLLCLCIVVHQAFALAWHMYFSVQSILVHQVLLSWHIVHALGNPA